MSTSGPVSESVQARKKLYVRLANFQDVDAIQDIFARSFQTDPLLNYFQRHTKYPEENATKEWKTYRSFFGFIVKSTLLLPGGRVTVVIDPETATDGPEGRIVAAACWHPPGKRLSFSTPIIGVKAGLLKCITGWGLRSFQRFSIAYPTKAHRVMHKCFEQKGDTKTNTDDSWYLFMTATDTSHQGRGCLSLLVREGFAHAPTSIFTLEATTAKSKDQYVHLGYELPMPIVMGKGKVNEKGMEEKGEKAVGVEIYSLAKWPPPPDMLERPIANLYGT